MKTLLAVLALSLSACASLEYATYKDYPNLSAEKRAACKAKAEPIYWEKATGGMPGGTTGIARLEAANAFEECMEK